MLPKEIKRPEGYTPDPVILEMFDELNAKSREYADKAYRDAGVKRKYTNEEYITHCDDIIQLLSEQVDSYRIKQLMAVIYLHDVIEDTPITEEELIDVFPGWVVDMVVELTDIDAKSCKLSRKERKALDCARLSKVSNNAKLIKLGDIRSNAKSIAKFDKQFSHTYTDECLNIVAGFSREEMMGDTDLAIHSLITYSELHGMMREIETTLNDRFIASTEGEMIKVPESVPTSYRIRLYDEALMNYARNIKGTPDKLRALGIKGNIFDKSDRPSWEQQSENKSMIPQGIDLLAQRLVVSTVRSYLEESHFKHLDKLDVMITYSSTRGINANISINENDDVTRAFFVKCSIPILTQPVWEKHPEPHWSFIDSTVGEGIEYKKFRLIMPVIAEIIKTQDEPI